jgi:hypothetical protein
MLDTTKPIKLTRSYIDSRGNHYPPKDALYYPGEIPESAWNYLYAIQPTIVEPVIMSETDTPPTPVVEMIADVPLQEEVLIEVTNPSTAREIKPQANSLDNNTKEIKPRTYKHTKAIKTN